MTQRVIPIHSPRFLDLTAPAAGELLDTAFPVVQPLALEIGCGIGDFIVPLASARPQTNFLAIDIYNKGCLKTCKKLDAAGLANVRVARIEARQLIARHVAPQSLCAVYINCPDPWPKKRHRERRLVNADFLAMLRYALQPGGELFFSSDVGDYAEEVAALITPECGFVNLLPTPFALQPPPDYPRSKYMRRFLDLGQPIHFLHLRRLAGAAALPHPPEVRRGFRVRREALTHGA